jgi:LuxR family maltose regulon positive regulatory protein
VVNILATKLHRPALHSNRVQRPHLVRRLNEGLEAGLPLTLVCAPAGFGKTTSVSEWLDGLDLPVSWLALDRSDDDPGRFFAYFVAALQKVDASLGVEVESALRSGQMPPLEAVVATLIEDVLHVGRPFVLVLDDFHLIQDGAILRVLESLLASRLPLLHLVLVTREDPLLPLARLRANNRMTEIRAGDLRFSAAETDRFFKEIMNLSLPAEDIAALENRTEGWVAGLQLAGLSMRGRADPSSFIANLSGSHRYILSYLTEEVLSQQSSDVQDFLLHTSILDRLTGDLCDAVTGRQDSSQLLERLFSANLFLVALDDEQHWYRYHHLFADLLRNRLRLLQKELALQLHRRASRWYEQVDMPNEAITHALSGEDFPRVVQLLERHAMPILTQGYAKTLEGWLRAVPEQWRVQSTRTNLAFAWTHLLRGSYQYIPPYLQQVEMALAQSGAADSDLRAEWLALRSSLANVQGRPGEGVQLARQALEAASPDNVYLLGLAHLGLGGGYRMVGDYPNLVDAYRKAIQYSRAAGVLLPEMISASALALMAIQYGELRFAFETGANVIDRFERSGSMPPPIAGTVYGTIGAVYYQWNQLEKAGEHFRRAAQMSRLVGHNAGTVYSTVLAARLAQASGDLERAARLTREAVDLLPQGIPAWLKPEVVEQQVRIALAQGNLAAAADVLRQQGVIPQNAHPPFEAYCLAYLRVALFRVRESQHATGQEDDALALSGRLVDAAVQAGRVGIALPALLLRAQLHAAYRNSQPALDDLDQALSLALPEENIRVFVDEGSPIAALLRVYLDRAVPGDEMKAAFGNKLLDAFPAPAEAAAPAANALSAGDDASSPRVLLEPLTGRELDVLRLIAEGLTYEEIAGRLVISLNTVRFYVKEIYSKLQVNNRTRAVEAARVLRIL